MQPGTLELTAAAKIIAAWQELATPGAVEAWKSNHAGEAPVSKQAQPGEAKSREDTLHRLELSSFRNWGINE
jgi:hypothetical protein